MPLSTQAQALVTAMATSGLPPFWMGSPQAVREQMSAFGQMIPRGPALHRVEELKIPTSSGVLAARLYVPSATPAALLLYFHGGGWVFGALDDGDATCRHLAHASGSALLSVDYRLAPEHPFPAAAEDAINALQWAAGQYCPWGQLPLFLVGDSAGGNLAAVATLMARDRGTPSIAGQLLIYPVISAEMNSASYKQFADGPLIGIEAMRWFFDQYVPNPQQRLDWRCSPARANLSGLPPTLVITAEFDPLRDEGEAYAKALTRNGSVVQMTRYSGVPHGFFTMPGLVDESMTAIKESAAWVLDALKASAWRKHAP